MGQSRLGGRQGAKAGPHSMRAEDARWLSRVCAKARSVSSRAQCSPRSTGQERSVLPRSRHSRTLPRPHDAILQRKHGVVTLPRAEGLKPRPYPSTVDQPHHLVSSKEAIRKVWMSKSVCTFARITTSPPLPIWSVPQATTTCNKPSWIV